MDGETWLTAEISIHAPLTGSDPAALWISKRLSNFNPRSPYGERPVPDANIMGPQGISIHAPLTGSDLLDINHDYTVRISNHAPLTGSDVYQECIVAT